MRVVKNFAAGAGLVLMLSGPVAYACGTAMLLPLLFKVYPEARTVFDATIVAREKNIIDRSDWPGAEIMGLHEWRMRKSALTMMALKRRLERVPIESNTNSNAHILFINEWVWSEISIGIAGIEISNGANPDNVTTYIFTTRRALDALLTGKLSYDDAIKQKLIKYRLKNIPSSKALDVFKQALDSKARQSVKRTVYSPSRLAE